MLTTKPATEAGQFDIRASAGRMRVASRARSSVTNASTTPAHRGQFCSGQPTWQAHARLLEHAVSFPRARREKADMAAIKPIKPGTTAPPVGNAPIAPTTPTTRGYGINESATTRTTRGFGINESATTRTTRGMGIIENPTTRTTRRLAANDSATTRTTRGLSMNENATTRVTG